MNFDPQSFEPSDPNTRPLKRKNQNQGESGAFSMAAMVLAILSVLFCMVFYLSLPMGALAILFALLSRGKGQITGRARASIITAAIAMVICTVMTASAALYIYRTPQLRSYVQSIWDAYYGTSDTPDTMLEHLLGEDSEDTQNDESRETQASEEAPLPETPNIPGWESTPQVPQEPSVPYLPEGGDSLGGNYI